jgi:hypothetical protein
MRDKHPRSGLSTALPSGELAGDFGGLSNGRVGGVDSRLAEGHVQGIAEGA